MIASFTALIRNGFIRLACVVLFLPNGSLPQEYASPVVVTTIVLLSPAKQQLALPRGRGNESRRGFRAMETSSESAPPAFEPKMYIEV